MKIQITSGSQDIVLEPRYDGYAKLYMPNTRYTDYENGPMYYKLTPVEMRILASNLVAFAKEVERLNK